MATPQCPPATEIAPPADTPDYMFDAWLGAVHWDRGHGLLAGKPVSKGEDA